MNYKLSQKGYILANGEIESIIYREYVGNYGSDETTTPRGVAPRLYVDGNSIYSWGCTGNRHTFYASFKNKTEANNTLYEIWEQNVENDWNAPRFFKTKKELFEDIAESKEKDFTVIKRYFRIKDNIAKNYQLFLAEEKIRKQNLAITTKENILNYIAKNKETIQTSLNELNAFKTAENKSEWQTKANSLVQKVSNNDFRGLNWKEVYNLIKETV